MKNPFPVRTVPEFIQHGDLQRALAIWPGHESIIIKQEDLEPGDGLRAGNFGISSDIWIFVVRDTDHAASLDVTPQTLNGRLIFGPGRPYAILAFCTSYPGSEEQVRESSASYCCMQQKGMHFHGACSSLDADPMILSLTSAFACGPPPWWTADEKTVRENLLALEGTWKKLEGWFVEQRALSQAAAHELPRQCPQCHGAGVVPHGVPQ